MYGDNSSNSINFIAAIAVIVIVVASILYRKFRVNIANPELIKKFNNDSVAGTSIYSDTSLIVTMYTSGVVFERVSDGMINNNSYTLSITTKKVYDSGSEDSDGDDVDSGIDDAISDNMHWETARGLPEIGIRENPTSESMTPLGNALTPEGQVIMKVVLATSSPVHIVGFSTKDTVFNSLLSNTGIDDLLTKVQLEGDFPDYFKLYCDKEKDIELRQVLDPTRMQFLVDFCNKMNWELIDNALYFVQSGLANNDGNNNTVVSSAESFVNAIIPTLYSMSRENNSQTTNDQATS